MSVEDRVVARYLHSTETDLSVESIKDFLWKEGIPNVLSPVHKVFRLARGRLIFQGPSDTWILKDPSGEHPLKNLKELDDGLRSFVRRRVVV
jgi:hypothetical protein